MVQTARRNGTFGRAGGAYSILSNEDMDWNPMLMNNSILTQGFFKDGGKSALLYLSPAYRRYKKNDYTPIFENGVFNAGMQYLFYLMGFGSRK